MSSAIVRTRGRITLPPAIRDALGVGVGDRVRFVVTQDGRVRVVADEARVSELAGLLRAESPVSIDDMQRAIEQGASEDDGQV